MTKEEKCSITQKNRIVIHKDDKEKRVYRQELDQWLSEGWRLGISEKHRASTSDAHKGKPSWNKGKPWSEETRRKMSENSSHHSSWNKGLTMETSEKLRDTIAKSSATKLERYGKVFVNNNMNETHRRKIGDALRGRKQNWSPEKKAQQIAKAWQTMLARGTCNRSQPEIEMAKKLKQMFPSATIMKQYKDPMRYPFHCDFYVKEQDLFIELNLHWSHGGHPFDPNSEADRRKLEIWRKKAETSKFYRQAIQVWTERDPLKLKTAQEHDLTYVMIYDWDYSQTRKSANANDERETAE